jgi:hypothetical protein
MNLKCLNLSALVAVVGAGACLLAEISDPGASPAASQPPPPAVAPAVAATTQKVQGVCPVCRPAATATASSPCPYLTAEGAKKAGCAKFGAAGQPAAGAH